MDDEKKNLEEERIYYRKMAADCITQGKFEKAAEWYEKCFKLHGSYGKIITFSELPEEKFLCHVREALIELLKSKHPGGIPFAQLSGCTIKEMACLEGAIRLSGLPVSSFVLIRESEERMYFCIWYEGKEERIRSYIIKIFDEYMSEEELKKLERQMEQHSFILKGWVQLLLLKDGLWYAKNC